MPSLAKAFGLARALDATNIADEIVLRHELDIGRLLLELPHVFGRQKIGTDDGDFALDLVLAQPLADTLAHLPVPRHLVRRDDVETRVARLVSVEMRYALLGHEQGGKSPSRPQFRIRLMSRMGRGVIG